MDRHRPLGFWAIGGGFWGNDLGLQQGDGAIGRLIRCYETESIRSLHCQPDFERDYSQAIQYRWYYVAIMALVPIPFAWLVVYGYIGLWRWKRRPRPSN
jgi:hypothetical protein